MEVRARSSARSSLQPPSATAIPASPAAIPDTWRGPSRASSQRSLGSCSSQRPTRERPEDAVDDARLVDVACRVEGRRSRFRHLVYAPEVALLDGAAASRCRREPRMIGCRSLGMATPRPRRAPRTRRRLMCHDERPAILAEAIVQPAASIPLPTAVRRPLRGRDSRPFSTPRVTRSRRPPTSRHPPPRRPRAPSEDPAAAGSVSIQIAQSIGSVTFSHCSAADACRPLRARSRRDPRRCREQRTRAPVNKGERYSAGSSDPSGHAPPVLDGLRNDALGQPGS